MLVKLIQVFNSVLISFIVTFVLYALLSSLTFVNLKFSTGLGALALIIIALAVGFREFGYDFYSYKKMYDSIVSGEGYGTELMTYFLVDLSQLIGIGFRGFLAIYSLLTFSLVYFISRLERINLLMFLSVYCIFLFGTGPLVTIRSSASSLIFAAAVLLYFRRRYIFSLGALILSVLFHGAAIAAVALLILVVIGRFVCGQGGVKSLLFYFAFVSLAIHSSVTNPGVTEYIGEFFGNEFILALAIRVAAYQEYVWLDFSSLVHYFIFISIPVTILCYRRVIVGLRVPAWDAEGCPSEQWVVFIVDLIKFALIFNLFGFLTFNLVWGVRIMEYFIPLLVVLVVKFGCDKKNIPLLLLYSINSVTVFLGYMSSLNWKS